MVSVFSTGRFFPRYQQKSQCYGDTRVLPAYLADVLDNCKDLFHRNLYGHFGCVNAIEFSNKGGSFLVSGGDDRRVMLWNMNEVCAGIDKPLSMKGEHRSNIFCTVFDNDNTHIFSGGNDEQVSRHDVQTRETVGMYFHDEAVYGISVHPENDEIFVTACDDGRVLMWDTRSTEPSVLTAQQSAFHAAVFNPVEPYLIATANSSHGVALWDTRVPSVALMNYGCRSYNCAMGVKFNDLGTRLTVLGRRLPPVLYCVERPTPIMEFHHPGYVNSCTMKSSCFAGNKDQFIVSGSDDFNVYVWKIPEENDPNCKPIIISRAHLVLKGHRSIVNQVRFNPQTHTLCTAGVEKVIKVWSPYRMPECRGDVDRSPKHTKREFFSHQDYIEFILESGRPLGHEYDEQSQEEDPRMLAFFDSLIQREQSGSSTDSDESLLSTGESYLRFVNDDSSDSSFNERRGMNTDRLRELILRPRSEGSDSHNQRATLRRLRKLATAFMLREISDSSSDSSALESGHEDQDGQSLQLRLSSLAESAKPSTSNFDPFEVRGSTPDLNQNGSCVHGIKAKFRSFRRGNRRYRGQLSNSQTRPAEDTSSDENEDFRGETSYSCNVRNKNCSKTSESTSKADDENVTAAHNLEQLGKKSKKGQQHKKKKLRKKRVKNNCSGGTTNNQNNNHNGINSESKSKVKFASLTRDTTESSSSSSDSEDERRRFKAISKRQKRENHDKSGDQTFENSSDSSSSSEDSLLSGQNTHYSSSTSSSSDSSNDLPNTIDEGPWVKRSSISKHRRRKRSYKEHSQPLLRKYSRSPQRRPNGSSVDEDK